MNQNAQATILLLEADASLGRLMSLGLQQRGLRVIAVASTEQFWQKFEEEAHIDLLLVDPDRVLVRETTLLAQLQEQAALMNLPVVVLSWETQPAPRAQTACIAKPFDARALYTTIEHLLSQQAHERAAQEAHIEAVMLARYTQQARPSIWPFVTAGGLLLACIGLLSQMTLCIPGLLVSLCAILLWTLGSRSRHKSFTLPSWSLEEQSSLLPGSHALRGEV
jgi:CheY-like chemotaxis protein